MIETKISRKHFSEKAFEAFINKCFELKNPKQFKDENERFFRFLYDDLKIIIQIMEEPSHIAEITKLVNYFSIEDDPEILDYLQDSIMTKIQYMTIDEILTSMVNFAHTLSP